MPQLFVVFQIPFTHPIQDFLLDVQCYAQFPNVSLQLSDPRRLLLGRLTARFKKGRGIFNELVLPLGELIFTDVMAAAQFRL